MPTPAAATLARLRLLRDARAAGVPVSFTTDAAWLVEQAINRRGGYLDDPSGRRGSCRPTDDGRYPSHARGSELLEVERIARRINTPRLRVYEDELRVLPPHWQHLLRERLAHRLARRGDE